jgi:hypothetical protein
MRARVAQQRREPVVLGDGPVEDRLPCEGQVLPGGRKRVAAAERVARVLEHDPRDRAGIGLRCRLLLHRRATHT